MPIYINNNEVAPYGVESVYVGNQLVYNSAPVPTTNFLCIKCINPGFMNKIKLISEGDNPPNVSVYYSFNKRTWQQLIVNETEISIVADECVYFKGNNNEFSSNSGYNKFSIPGGIYEVSGDITTLLNEDGNITDLTNYGTCVFQSLFKDTKINSAENLVLTPTTLTYGCYSCMFQGCTSLTTASALPATTLADECYAYMFSGCSSLTNAPALPATTLTYYCYQHMFNQCTSLLNAPSLPATTLTQGCYNGMFYQCKSLVDAPSLPATTLVYRCYYFMFGECEALMSMNVSFTSWNDSVEATEYWTEGIYTFNGTFTCPESLPKEYGERRIPYYWGQASYTITITSSVLTSSTNAYITWNGGTYYKTNDSFQIVQEGSFQVKTRSTVYGTVILDGTTVQAKAKGISYSIIPTNNINIVITGTLYGGFTFTCTTVQ